MISSSEASKIIIFAKSKMEPIWSLSVLNYLMEHNLVIPSFSPFQNFVRFKLPAGLNFTSGII